MRGDPREASTKAHVRAIIEDLPDDTSIDQILRELAFDRLIRRGSSDRTAGRTTTTEALREQLHEWRG